MCDQIQHNCPTYIADVKPSHWIMITGLYHIGMWIVRSHGPYSLAYKDNGQSRSFQTLQER